ncbi:MAG: hypothetical protein ACRDO4_18140 [Nocardioides sp.]
MTGSTAVDLGGAVVLGLESRIREGVAAFGHRDGRPFVAWVRPDGAAFEATGLPSAGEVTSMCTTESFSVVVGESRPSVLFGNVDGMPDVIGETTFRPNDIYDVTEMADRFWVLCGDEDEFQLVLTGTGRLLAAECEVGELNLDAPALHLVGDVDSLVVGADDAGIYVAGDVADDDGSTGPLWVCPTTAGYGGWRPVALDPAPDLVTDVRSGIVALAAGVRDGRAVVHELHGDVRTGPDPEVDPAWPRVFADRGLLAAQTLTGPRLWLGDAEHVLPDGRLTAARSDGTGGVAWAIVDRILHRVG